MRKRLKHLIYFKQLNEAKKKEVNLELSDLKHSWDLNQKYNWDAVPKSAESDDRWYSNANKSEIGIGSEDPVKKFREWSSKFWRYNGEQDLKYEPRSGVKQKSTIEKIRMNNSKNEAVVLKNISDDVEYWDRIKFVSSNDVNEQIGYAVVDMSLTPDMEWSYMEDSDPAKFTDEEMERYFPDDLFAKIEHIEINSDIRGSGYGKELMNEVLFTIKNRGIKSVYLIAAPVGLSPQTPLEEIKYFYEGFGFEIVKDFGNAYDMVLNF